MATFGPDYFLRTVRPRTVRIYTSQLTLDLLLTSYVDLSVVNVQHQRRQFLAYMPRATKGKHPSFVL